MGVDEYEQMCYNIKNEGRRKMVERGNMRIDVISLCDTSGEIRPLRFRVEREDHQLLRVDIEEILSMRTIPYTGAEANIYLCRGRAEGREWVFELKYAIRSHCWLLSKKMYGWDSLG